MVRTRNRFARAATAQDGFTVVEVLVAVLVLTVGLIVLIGAFDPARRLSTQAERRQVASAIAEQEIQRVQALAWAKIALAAQPTVNANATTKDPTYYESAGPCVGIGPTSTPCYQWDWNKTSSSEAMVIDAPNADSTANPQNWTTTVTAAGPATRLSGKTYRFITWANDTECAAAACGAAADYKRVTVAVTVTGMTSPVELSTLVTNSAAGVNGNDPLADSTVNCNDVSGATTTTVPCVG